MDRLSALYRQFEIVAMAMDQLELADGETSADSFSPVEREVREDGEKNAGQRTVGSFPKRKLVGRTGKKRSFVVADIGADHGYLSRALLASGRCSKIIVTDIAEKPLAKAKENIGVDSKVEYRLGDGLSQGDFSDVDIFFIAGMGGDEVVKILGNAGRIKSSAVFVLQPMTHFDRVVDALGEQYAWTYFVNDNEKHYRVLVAGDFFQGEHPCFVKQRIPEYVGVTSESATEPGGVDMAFRKEKSFKGDDRLVSCHLEDEEWVSYFEMPMVLDYSKDYAEKKDRPEHVLVENTKAANEFFEAIDRGQSVVEENMKQSASIRHVEGLSKRRRQIEAVRKMLAFFREVE